MMQGGMIPQRGMMQGWSGMMAHQGGSGMLGQQQGGPGMMPQQLHQQQFNLQN